MHGQCDTDRRVTVCAVKWFRENKRRVLGKTFLNFNVKFGSPILICLKFSNNSKARIHENFLGPNIRPDREEDSCGLEKHQNGNYGFYRLKERIDLPFMEPSSNYPRNRRSLGESITCEFYQNDIDQ